MPSAQGWDADILIREHPLGFTQGSVRAEGLFINTITDSLEEGTQLRDRPERIKGGLFEYAGQTTVERAMPRGGLVVEPRTDDIPGILMSAFQAVDSSGTLKGGTHFYGTLTFISVDTQPDWTGSTWGTTKTGTGAIYGNYTTTVGDIYPLSVERRYRNNLTGASGVNSVAFRAGILNSLQWNQPANEDLQVNADFRFTNVSLIQNANDPPGAQGSYSARTRYVDWQATVSVGGDSTYDITAFQVMFDRKIGDKTTLGNRNAVAFPWSAHPSIEGSFDLAIGSLGPWDAHTSYLIQAHWQISANEWMQVVLPDARIRPFEKPIPGGEAELSYSIPFKGYASNGTSAMVVRLMGTFTNTTSIKNIWGFITAP